MLAILALATLSLLPLGWLVIAGATSWARGEAPPLDATAAILLGRSLALALLATTLAVAIGLPWGWTLARFRAPARGLWLAAGIVPLLLPPYAAATAWSLLLRPSGWLASKVYAAAGPSLTQSATAATIVSGLVLALCLWPIVGWSVYFAARAVPRELEEDARLAADAGRAVRASGAAFVTPAGCVAALAVFLLAAADFGVPSALGATVYPVEIVLRFQIDRHPGGAATLALPWLAIAAALFAAQGRGLRRWLAASTSGGSGPVIASPGAGALAAGTGFAAWVLATLLPLGVLVRYTERWDVLPRIWLENQAPLVASAALGGAAALLVTALALMLEWCAGVDRARPARGLGVLRAAAILPYALPGSLLAVALTGLLNRPGALGDLYNSRGVLVWAYGALFLPFALLILAPGWRRVDPSLREAALLEGAGAGARFWLAAWPAIRPLAVIAGMLVFLLAGREMDATALLRPPGVETAAFRIHDYLHYQPRQEVTALCLILVAELMLVVGAVAAWLWRSERRS